MHFEQEAIERTTPLNAPRAASEAGECEA